MIRPQSVTCWRQGPWTGRGDDVSVVLDLMIHDLDLVHTLVPGAVTDVQQMTDGRVGTDPDVVADRGIAVDGGVVANDTPPPNLNPAGNARLRRPSSWAGPKKVYPIRPSKVTSGWLFQCPACASR